MIFGRTNSFRLINVLVLIMLLGPVAVPTGLTLAAPAGQSGGTPLTLPPGFSDTVAIGGLLAPRDFVFAPAPDRRVFILERGGISDNGTPGNTGDDFASDDINFASIRIYDPNTGQLSPRQLTNTIKTCGDSERGAVGIIFDPGFLSNNYIYVYYTRQSPPGSGQSTCAYNTFQNGLPGPRNRVSRFTMSGDTVIADSEKVLIDTIVTDVGYHNGGDLSFDADGYLYISTGDGGNTTLPQLTNNLNGKILRIKPDVSDPRGYITAGNFFETASGARTCGTTTPDSGSGPCKEVYAFGFRNPFRFTMTPSVPGLPLERVGRPFVGDVGGGVWEEVDLVTPGGNFGHPLREGPCPNGVSTLPCQQDSNYINPVYAYLHANIGGNTDSAIIGGAFYTGTIYPTTYQNRYYFADFVRGFVRQLQYNAGSDSWSAPAQDFSATAPGRGIIGMVAGPGGATWGDDLYYVNYLSDNQRTSAIRRIQYVGAVNIAPTAVINASPPSCHPAPCSITFSAVGSVDPDGNAPLKYTWNFGDGIVVGPSTSPTATHQYAKSQNYVVTLTVTDNHPTDPKSGMATMTAYPGNQPAIATIQLINQTEPARTASSTYYAGDTWQYEAINLADPDGALPPNALNWEIPFHHRDHSHPFLSNLSGNSGTFTIPTSGETDPDVWFRVVLYITDGRGQVTTLSRDVNPALANVTFVTNPPGGTLTFEGHLMNTPSTVQRVVGLNVGLSAPPSLNLGGVINPFGGWSNGGPQTQTFTVPAENATITAYFGPAAAPIRNLVTTPTPTLTWTRVTWATGYQIQLAASPSFARPIPPQPQVINDPNQLSWQVPASASLTNGTYYYRVRACNGATCGSWSAVESFNLQLP